MGNRAKGTPKKKGIKAALGSNAGSKRKLSRMGKKQKKHHSGLEASFIGRSRCLSLLQINLKDFRRLCILKGIYPREPIGRVPGDKKGQTFYHIKDIRAIAHEPVLEKFRDFGAFMKKVRRAAGRNERDEANRKNALVPTYTLHHLVKERYPRFMDALSDVDDALTLAHLFAALPGEGDIKPGVTNKAKTLVAAWGAYCATTSSITKSFISVKGVYTEASIRGSTIRWVVPHSFTQYLPEDVDYRVMMTFFEFYETLLNFVLYKLYNEIGVRYPFPLKDIGGETSGSTSSVLGANLRALRNALDSSKGAVSNVVSAAIQSSTNEKEKASKESGGKQKSNELVKSVGAALSKLTGEDSDAEEENDDDSVDVQGPLQAALENMAEEQARASVPGADDGVDDDALKRRRLFEGLTFFLSREVPRGYLELVCLAFGGKVGWEGDDSPISMKDVRITHHIVDRPQVPGSYDTLPKSREYVQPQWILDCANFMFLLPIARYAAGAELPPHLSPWVDDEEEGYKPAYAEEIERIKNGESVEPREASLKRGEEEADEEMEEDDIDVNEDEEEEEEDSEEEEDNDEVRQRKERKRKKDEEEVHDLAKTVMSRKASHLYGRMQHGIAAKQSKVQNLKDRRKEIEMTKEKDSAGRTVLKQKYDRVKKERKILNDTYTDTGGSMKKSKKAKKSS